MAPCPSHPGPEKRAGRLVNEASFSVQHQPDFASPCHRRRGGEGDVERSGAMTGDLPSSLRVRRRGDPRAFLYHTLDPSRTLTETHSATTQPLTATVTCIMCVCLCVYARIGVGNMLLLSIRQKYF